MKNALDISMPLHFLAPMCGESGNQSKLILAMGSNTPDTAMSTKSLFASKSFPNFIQIQNLLPRPFRIILKKSLASLSNITKPEGHENVPSKLSMVCMKKLTILFPNTIKKSNIQILGAQCN
jgi:hypothetical protein